MSLHNVLPMRFTILGDSTYLLKKQMCVGPRFGTLAYTHPYMFKSMHKLRKMRDCVNINNRFFSKIGSNETQNSSELLPSAETQKKSASNLQPSTKQGKNNQQFRAIPTPNNPDMVGLSNGPNLNANNLSFQPKIPFSSQLELGFDKTKRVKKGNLCNFDIVKSKRKSWAANEVRKLRKLDLNLDIRLCLKIAKNGEGKAYITEKRKPKQKKINFENNSKSARKKGNLVQKGLTKHAKRTIRIVSDCYNEEIKESNEYNNYCRFITLTYRNIIPTDQEAKKHLNAFFQRIRRTKPNAHYLWVAEVQTKREKRTGQRAIHFHILTPEKLHKPEDGDDLYRVKHKERLWLNRAWNEIVAKDSLKKERITKEEFNTWMLELDQNEGYNDRLFGFRNGERQSKPKKPKRSTHLLLPNLEMVYYAGRYMAKYISKDGQNIIGNMWNCSRESRKFLKPLCVVDKGFNNHLSAVEIMDYLEWKMKEERRFLASYRIEYNDAPLLWTKDGLALLEHYFDYMEYKETERERIQNTRARQKRKILLKTNRNKVLINSG